MPGTESSHYAYHLDYGTLDEYIRTLPEGYSVRCVLDLHYNILNTITTALFAYRVSSATMVRVLLTVLRSVKCCIIAARAPMLTTATRTTYGQVHLAVLQVFIR